MHGVLKAKKFFYCWQFRDCCFTWSLLLLENMHWRKELLLWIAILWPFVTRKLLGIKKLCVIREWSTFFSAILNEHTKWSGCIIGENLFPQHGLFLCIYASNTCILTLMAPKELWLWMILNVWTKWIWAGEMPRLVANLISYICLEIETNEDNCQTLIYAKQILKSKPVLVFWQ